MMGITAPAQVQGGMQSKGPTFSGRKPVELGTGDDFFCKMYRGEVSNRMVGENQNAFAVLDGYPVGRGHTLVVPKRHFGNFFDAKQKEINDIMKLLRDCKTKLETTLKEKRLPLPDGYNVGINVGEAAGQTVDHLHVHLIPRYKGDMDDPRGGVRGVIPEKQKYSGPPDESVSKLYFDN